MITLSKGRVKRKGLKVLVYGPEGIGKSTFASQFPAPILTPKAARSTWTSSA